MAYTRKMMDRIGSAQPLKRREAISTKAMRMVPMMMSIWSPLNPVEMNTG